MIEQTSVMKLIVYNLPPKKGLLRLRQAAPNRELEINIYTINATFNIIVKCPILRRFTSRRFISRIDCKLDDNLSSKNIFII